VGHPEFVSQGVWRSQLLEEAAYIPQHDGIVVTPGGQSATIGAGGYAGGTGGY
jgi:hypothetical protein